MGDPKTEQVVSVHYVGTFDDGTEFDNSRTRGAPLQFKMGVDQMIPGFEAAVSDMSVGESKTIRLTTEDAYGDIRSELIHSVSRQLFSPEFELEVGVPIQGHAPDGQPFMATVDSFDDESVVLNLNHPMAGKNLNFEIELLSAG